VKLATTSSSRRWTAARSTTQELDADFAIWRDSAGVVRRLDAQLGTDDMARMEHFYYDEHGKLRFIFGQYGHVSGAHMEERVYYDENRHEVRRLRERAAKGTYPFGGATPLWTPASWFRQFCSHG
jgi:hypothetical protein